MAKAINQIEYGGELYEFSDTKARDDVVSLGHRVTSLNDQAIERISAEYARAKAAEEALENTKMTKIPDKGLSTNDFTDEYKEMLENPLEMLGASDTGDGRKGVVPKPLQGDEDKYLKGDGTWGVPHDTTYGLVDHDNDGLMSATDKVKLDKVDTDIDELMASNTVFGTNTITETLGNGKIKKTTFNSDGSITQEITKAGAAKITLVTVFNADGSITRTRS